MAPNIDKWEKIVTFSFAEFLSYHYTTVRTGEGYRHKQGGVFYTTEQVWNVFHEENEFPIHESKEFEL